MGFTAPVRVKEMGARGMTSKSRSMMSQINARIDTAIKHDADAAFEHAGIAPSEAVRALYARAAALGSSLTSVGDLVVGEHGDYDAQKVREDAFRRATHAFDNTLARFGFTVDVSSFAPMTAEEIEEEAYRDFLSGDAL